MVEAGEFARDDQKDVDMFDQDNIDGKVKDGEMVTKTNKINMITF
jgi:hypothetical protein